MARKNSRKKKAAVVEQKYGYAPAALDYSVLPWRKLVSVASKRIDLRRGMGRNEILKALGAL